MFGWVGEAKEVGSPAMTEENCCVVTMELVTAVKSAMLAQHLHHPTPRTCHKQVTAAPLRYGSSPQTRFHFDRSFGKCFLAKGGNTIFQKQETNLRDQAHQEAKGTRHDPGACCFHLYVPCGCSFACCSSTANPRLCRPSNTRSQAQLHRSASASPGCEMRQYTGACLGQVSHPRQHPSCTPKHVQPVPHPPAY